MSKDELVFRWLMAASVVIAAAAVGLVLWLR